MSYPTTGVETARRPSAARLVLQNTEDQEVIGDHPSGQVPLTFGHWACYMDFPVRGGAGG